MFKQGGAAACEPRCLANLQARLKIRNSTSQANLQRCGEHWNSSEWAQRHNFGGAHGLIGRVLLGSHPPDNKCGKL